MPGTPDHGKSILRRVLEKELLRKTEGLPTEEEIYTALNALPVITKEEGMKMRTGRPTPNESDVTR